MMNTAIATAATSNTVAFHYSPGAVVIGSLVFLGLLIAAIAVAVRAGHPAHRHHVPFAAYRRIPKGGNHGRTGRGQK